MAGWLASGGVRSAQGRVRYIIICDDSIFIYLILASFHVMFDLRLRTLKAEAHTHIRHHCDRRAEGTANHVGNSINSNLNPWIAFFLCRFIVVDGHAPHHMSEFLSAHLTPIERTHGVPTHIEHIL